MGDLFKSTAYIDESDEQMSKLNCTLDNFHQIYGILISVLSMTNVNLKSPSLINLKLNFQYLDCYTVMTNQFRL